MPTDPQGTGLLRELKRRRVPQVVIAYLVASWAMIEVAGVVFPALEMPAWTLKLVILLAALGFAPAVVLAWAFDLTREGVRRTPAHDPAEPVTAAKAGAGSNPGKSLAYIGVGMVLTLLTAGAASMFLGGNQPPVEGLRSIAVLPFENMSADSEQEYFSDGLTEELLNVLAKIPALQVAARTSSFAFKGQHEDVREIGRRLGVDVIIEGSVRKSGESIRITAQLIKVSDGYHLWSETYDAEMEDIFAVQERISRAIADALQIELATESETLLARPTGNAAAYDLYLQGRHVLREAHSEEERRRAIALLEEAIFRDGRFARAHAALAEAYLELARHAAPHDALARAKAAALKAVDLGDHVAETHTAVAHVRLHYDFDWAAAEQGYRRAIDLAPSAPEPYLTFAHFLASARRFEEALDASRRGIELRRAQSVDTAKDQAGEMVIWTHALYEARRYEEAMEVSREALSRMPGAMGIQHALAEAALAVGQPEIAIPIFEHMAHGNSTEALVDLGQAYARAGRTDDARVILRRIEQRAASEYVPNTELAQIYLALGERDRAITLLEAAADAREYDLPHIHGSLLFDQLRGEPRFDALMRRIGPL